jgi:hypothetical protein
VTNKLISLWTAVAALLILLGVNIYVCKNRAVETIYECDMTNMFDILSTESSAIDTTGDNRFDVELVIQPNTPEESSKICLSLMRAQYELVESTKDYAVFQFVNDGEPVIFIYLNSYIQ